MGSGYNPPSKEHLLSVESLENMVKSPSSPNQKLECMVDLNLF